MSVERIDCQFKNFIMETQKPNILSEVAGAAATGILTGDAYAATEGDEGASFRLCED